MSIKFGKKPISRSEYVRFLGLLIDEYLYWKCHITELTKKLSRRSCIFLNVRHILSLDVLKTLYYSIFSSFLSYGSTTWGLSYDNYLGHLFLVLKKVLRFISFQNFPSPSSTVFASLKILKLKVTIHQDILKFVFKSLNHLSPPHFHNYFEFNNTIHFHGASQALGGNIYQSAINTF